MSLSKRSSQASFRQPPSAVSKKSSNASLAGSVVSEAPSDRSFMASSDASTHNPDGKSQEGSQIGSQDHVEQMADTYYVEHVINPNGSVFCLGAGIHGRPIVVVDPVDLPDACTVVSGGEAAAKGSALLVEPSELTRHQVERYGQEGPKPAVLYHENSEGSVLKMLYHPTKAQSELLQKILDYDSEGPGSAAEYDELREEVTSIYESLRKADPDDVTEETGGEPSRSGLAFSYNVALLNALVDKNPKHPANQTKNVQDVDEDGNSAEHNGVEIP